MSENSTSQEPLVCKPTKWFLWRALAMLVMFSVFAVLFFQDGMWGYREKNLHFYVHQAFVKAGLDFQEMQNDGEVTEISWKEFAAEQKVAFPDDATAVLPKGIDIEMPWPDTLVAGYSIMDEKGGQNGAVDLWKGYTASRKEVEGKAWDIDPGEEPLKASKIRDQFIALAVCVVLMLVTLFFLVRTMRRSITADHEALHTQDGRRIAYTDMTRVDKRKWDNKGLALIYYQDGGEEKKAKVDGMVYGQFKEEDGAPAEKLFSRIMENFKGEVIEYLSEDSEDDQTAEDNDGAPKTGNET